MINSVRVPVFFYGTFMDASVLQVNAIDVSHTEPTRLLDYELSVRPRVNLHRSTNEIVYGAIAQVTHQDIDRLYTGLKEEFGITYRPFPVSSISHDGTVTSSLCYISEAFADEGPDPNYIDELAECAKRVGAPKSYLERIYSFLV